MFESTHHNFQPVSNQHLTPLIPSARGLHSVHLPRPLILSTPCTFQPGISARSSLLLPPKTQPITPALHSPMLHTNIQSTIPAHSSFLFPPLSLSVSVLLIQTSAKHSSASLLLTFYIYGNIFFSQAIYCGVSVVRCSSKVTYYLPTVASPCCLWPHDGLCNTSSHHATTCWRRNKGAATLGTGLVLTGSTHCCCEYFLYVLCNDWARETKRGDNGATPSLPRAVRQTPCGTCSALQVSAVQPQAERHAGTRSLQHHWVSPGHHPHARGIDSLSGPCL